MQVGGPGSGRGNGEVSYVHHTFLLYALLVVCVEGEEGKKVGGWGEQGEVKRKGRDGDIAREESTCGER